MKHRNRTFLNYNYKVSRLLFHLLVTILIVLSIAGCQRTSSVSTVTAPVTSPAAEASGISDTTDQAASVTLLPSNISPVPTGTDLAETTTDITTEAAPTVPVTVTPTPAPEVSTVNLLAVGDNLIHIQVIESGEQADGTYNYDHLYSNIKDDISAADIAVINQETIFGGEEFPYSGYPEFNSPTQIGDAVIAAGFDVVLQATNHTMDMGVTGIKNALAYWKKHPGIAVLGIHESEEASKEITIVEKNGIKIAMLNYTFGLNGHKLPEGESYLVDLIDRDKMEADIEKAEEEADFTIVFPHWGTEYVYEPIRSQEELTQFYYDQGVDLVIGTHPHVLEPVEWIDTEPGHKMLVYYSLGNFMSYQKEAPRMLGGIANVTITKDQNGTFISDASITPIVTHYENGPADYNFAIYKLSDYTAELAAKHGVSEIAQEGSLTYEDTYNLAKQVLGEWFR
jgi:poly-gamma-glutamate synthesis protein (capsule biosynthesis protein)